MILDKTSEEKFNENIKNINMIIINQDNIEMEIGSNFLRERLNFIIGMLITLLLLIAVFLMKLFLF